MKTVTRFLPTGGSYKRSIFVIVLLVSIYLLDITGLETYMGSFKYTYMLKPAIWICMAIFIRSMPHIRSKSKLKHRGIINLWAFNFSFIYILITIFAGLVYGFGKSPFDHSLRGIIINIIFVGTALVGTEFIRGYLVSNLAKKENYLVFIGVALLMTVISYPISKYMQLNNLQNTVIFLAESFVPELSHNIFASYLVFLGGPITSIIYLGFIQAFNWLSPILPSLKWIVTAIIGVLCPIFFMMFFQSIYLSTAGLIKKGQDENRSTFSWVLVSIISIATIWFAVGVFPIYPSVIATGSMEPLIYPGDIILVNKITKEERIKDLKADDIIQFKKGSILMSHRIIEVADDDEYGLLFTTKGDNNSASDGEPVKPQDIRGKIEYVIPKLGWPSLLIRSSKDIPFDEITRTVEREDSLEIKEQEIKEQEIEDYGIYIPREGTSPCPT